VPQAKFLKKNTAAGIFLRILVPQAKLFIILAPQPKKLEGILAPQAKNLEVDALMSKKQDHKNEIGDLGAPKSSAGSFYE
jgi:hypothetical protein